MKFIADRESLLTAVRLTAPLPIKEKVNLGARNFLRVVANGTVAVEACGRDCYLRFDVPGCRIEEPGQALLWPEKTEYVLDVAQVERVELAGDDKGVHFGCGYAQHDTEETFDASAFAVPEAEGGDPLTIDAAALLAQIDAVAFTAASRSRLRELEFDAITGVQLVAEDKRLTLAATNGHRLIWAEAKAEGATWKNKPALTRQSLGVLARVLEAIQPGAATVEVRADPNSVIFVGPAFRLVAMQESGRFPNWRDIVPKNPGKLTLKAGAFAAALRQAATVAENIRPVRFDWTEEELALSASTPDGRSLVRIPCKPERGCTATYSARQLIPVVSRVDPEAEITLEYGGKRQDLLVDMPDGVRCVITACVDK